MIQARSSSTKQVAWFALLACTVSCAVDVVSCQRLPAQESTDGAGHLDFHALPDLPDEIGVAGPLVGVHRDMLIVAGGANFAAPDDPQLWDAAKQYHDRAWVMERVKSASAGNGYRWRTETESFRLDHPVAYSAVVNTPLGVVCMGGENQNGLQRRAFLLSWQKSETGQWFLAQDNGAVPDLPLPASAGGAAVVGDYIYLVAGEVQTESGQRQATRIVWRLHLNSLGGQNDSAQQRWQTIESWPESAPPRTHSIVTAQHDGFGDRLFVIGGRRFAPGTDRSDLSNLNFFSDVWSLDPAADESPASGKSPWRRESDAPRPLSAGTALPFGPAHIMVLSYADGSRIKQLLGSGLAMREFQHPGFPQQALAYHTVTRTWRVMGEMPVNQVTTPATRWNGDMVLISGEIRPRVRTRANWRIDVARQKPQFGFVNGFVVVAYLALMLSIGAYFTLRNKNTDDFFRGGKHIPWWAAGCSIFATMLSSITYMAVPAKAFAQDWVYAMGNVIILCVAPIAIYIALPFFRRIDATSAYEYLEKRFNRPVRMIGSGSFTLFHIFRMGVVMALASLALASVTPLTPSQCVLVMGVLSITYCTLGGIEAVVWTDTIQTFILIGGAILCLAFAVLGSSPGSFQSAVDAGKLHVIHLDFGPTSFTTMAIWVVILGGFGQNLASYTADQAVVQRYMTTPSQRLAARSIWLNGFMAIPAALIFFGMGTAFWMFYHSHPEKLDPTIAADQIMPLFISRELPIGLAGLVVAGIFAAAQSTVSTSMNSGATTLVTDFLRPAHVARSEKNYLWLARIVTITLGVLGTLAGLLFVNPQIKSLFDEFISVLGLFMGVLAGLFALGATTRRANSAGGLVGAAAAIFVMTTIFMAANDHKLFFVDWQQLMESLLGFKLFLVNGYLYAFIGIVVCYGVGYLVSLVSGRPAQDLAGLTLFTDKPKSS